MNEKIARNFGEQALVSEVMLDVSAEPEQHTRRPVDEQDDPENGLK